MERLWSPWRLAYRDRHRRFPVLIFCEAPGREHEPLVVARGTRAYVILNLYPYNSGHLMVVPYRHVASLAGLSTEELTEVAQLTQRTEIVLTEVYQPQGINVGINLGRPAGAGSPITCTYTWSPGGRATPTSCRSSATCGSCPKKCTRARSGCGRVRAAGGGRQVEDPAAGPGPPSGPGPAR